MFAGRFAMARSSVLPGEPPSVQASGYLRFGDLTRGTKSLKHYFLYQE
jgi:hypothetical protein